MKIKTKNNNLRSYLKDADYLMVETLEELNVCIKHGLNKKTKVISFNPHVLYNKTYDIESPEKNLNSNYYTNLAEITKEYSGRVYNQVYDYTKDRCLAKYSSQYIIAIQNVLNKSSLVLELVKRSKLVITYPDFSKNSLNTRINGDFYNFIENFDNINTFQIRYENKDQFQLGRDPLTKFWKRFYFEGFNSILFRVLTIFCSRFNKYWQGKVLIYSHENTLLKGTASYLFRKGYFIEKLSAKINNKKLSKNKILDKVVNLIFPNILEYQEKIFKNLYNEKCSFFFQPFVKKYISDYLNYKAYWERYFINYKKNKIAVCLIGTPNSAMELSYIEVAKKNSIITASFQHGITKEISEDILSIDVLYESNIVDYYFVFNEEAAKNSKKSRFNIASGHVVGLAEDMKKGLKNQKYNKAQPILYASTTLYCGNRGIPGRSGTSDINKANFEINLIERVLSKLPHQVQYKPYFSKRYAGPSVELEVAKNKNNISINFAEVDLRYIVGDSRIIITSRATSTLGWCILSGKPVVYIENEDNRLNEIASKEFRKNLFFFDVREKKWDIKLRELLSLPLNTIEKKWKQKEVNRKFFIEKFFGDQETNAEKNCASILLNRIKNIS